MQNTFPSLRSRGRGRGYASRGRKEDCQKYLNGKPTSRDREETLDLSPLRHSDYDAMFVSENRDSHHRRTHYQKNNGNHDERKFSEKPTTSNRSENRGSRSMKAHSKHSKIDSLCDSFSYSNNRESNVHSGRAYREGMVSSSDYVEHPFIDSPRPLDVSNFEPLIETENGGIAEKLAKLRLELCLTRDDLKKHEDIVKAKKLAIGDLELQIETIEKSKRNKETNGENIDENNKKVKDNTTASVTKQSSENNDISSSSEPAEMTKNKRQRHKNPTLSVKSSVSEQNDQTQLSMSSFSSSTDEKGFTKPSVAKRLNPARVTSQNRIEVYTNLWDINVTNKIVYCYDVNVDAVLVNGEKISRVPLTGKASQATKIERSQMCLAALRIALRAYATFRNITGTVYDGSSLLYCNEELVAEKPGGDISLELPIEEMPIDIGKTIRWPDIHHFELRISLNTERPTFNVADFSNESNRDMSEGNKTHSQFLNLLTNQSASFNGYTVFGGGKLFDLKKDAQKIGGGQERRECADKGIKFIEGNSGNSRNPNKSILPALLLDSKCGTFFTEQCILKTLKEYMGNRFELNWVEINKKMENGVIKDVMWNDMNQYVKGLRFSTTYNNNSDYTISGISTKPIKELRVNLGTGDKEIPILENIANLTGKEISNFNPNNPAVVVKRIDAKKVIHIFHFALETVIVMPNQRVPNSKEINKAKSIKPQERYNRIMYLINELNLHDGGSRNDFLKMFGVSLSLSPKKVSGIRRNPPEVIFHGNKKAGVDPNRCNWNGKNLKTIYPATMSKVVVAYDRRNTSIGVSATRALKRKCEEFGLKITEWIEIYSDAYGNNMKDTIMNMTKDVSNRGTDLMLIFIDTETNKSHDILKLAERKYLITTQHVTLEKAKMLDRQHATALNIVKKMNVKLGGLNYRIEPEVYAQNKWISNDSILIISYDVAHPGKINVNDVVMQPSVVGFSYNGGVHRESFVGDFHYQYPKLERVDSEILNVRTKWMLDVYIKNRKIWPKSVLVIRDGVSDGQYSMVLNDELEAIKEGCMEYGRMHGKIDWCPPMGLAIVTKRHLARLFKKNGGKMENVKPLTVVDSEITRQNINEAYIVSSHAIQGTARPIYYQLLKNELGFADMDEFEAFMLALTFHHQISDMSISLPEPVYQADEWAKRGNNLWKVYNMNYTIPMKKSVHPGCADFEKMTSNLAFWKTALCDKRINA